jgi:hypothetical protein
MEGRREGGRDIQFSQVRHYRGADETGGAGCGVKIVMLTINSCERMVGRKGVARVMEGR